MTDAETTAAPPRTRVLYIAGLGKSGTTIVSMILGQIPGFVAVGELRKYWARGFSGNEGCSCDLAFDECPFWSKVSSEAFADDIPGDAPLSDAVRDVLRLRRIPLYLVPGGWPRMRRAIGDYQVRFAAFYGDIAKHSGARVIVDESKMVVYLSLLADIPSIDLFVLHLVRDPRGSAFSWSAFRHAQRGPTDLPVMTMSVPKAALLWQITNSVIERKFGGRDGRYLRVRYEDFVRAPRVTLRRVLAMLGEADAALPFVSEREAIISQTHLMSGNHLARRGTGLVEIRADEEWRVAMSRQDKFVASVLSVPMLFRYGYRLRG